MQDIISGLAAWQLQSQRKPSRGGRRGMKGDVDNDMSYACLDLEDDAADMSHGLT